MGTKKGEKDTLATCVSRIVVAFFSFQKRLVRKPMRPFFFFFFLPRSWHWSSKWRTCLGISIAVRFVNNSLRQLSISHVNRTTLERHLKIALDRHSHIFLDKNTRGGVMGSTRTQKREKRKKEREKHASFDPDSPH